jgi:hypothetical protein
VLSSPSFFRSSGQHGPDPKAGARSPEGVPDRAATGREGEDEVKKIVAVALVLVALMPSFNPGKQEFDTFILVHVKKNLHLEKGAFGDQVVSFLGPALIDQMSSRKDCFFFSFYTLRLPRHPPRYFLGFLHIFLPV